MGISRQPESPPIVAGVCRQGASGAIPSTSSRARAGATLAPSAKDATAVGVVAADNAVRRNRIERRLPLIVNENRLNNLAICCHQRYCFIGARDNAFADR